ncbi:MAG: hypothetical protein ACLTLY_05105 [Agathobacter rectalis]
MKYSTGAKKKHHKDLVELAYYLPAGIGADYLYMYAVVSLITITAKAS